MPAYDFLIVGAGLYGSTCAHELTRRGYACLVVDRRVHVGGNCYTECIDGINVHRYGPHIFHTSNDSVWQWISQFTSFNGYRHRVKVIRDSHVYSFPINLHTLNDVFGVTTPYEASQLLASLQTPHSPMPSFEEWVISQIGEKLYVLLFRDYTEKQWGRSARELPASIAKRLPIRTSYNDEYFDDRYQGIPNGGYTNIFRQLLCRCTVHTSCDYFLHRGQLDALARHVIYTGPLDRFFGYSCGKLAYRSLRFETARMEIPDFQGAAQVNYASKAVPYTRIVEHKHFEFGKQPHTLITKEFSADSGEALEELYPVRDNASLTAFSKYSLLASSPELGKYSFGGRLAQYRYLDMHQIIAMAIRHADRLHQVNVAASKCATLSATRGVWSEELDGA